MSDLVTEDSLENPAHSPIVKFCFIIGEQT
ncbi:hypothetical protein LSS_21720 [Leptospira santarosai serovar Shermani str. LT 821]|uniref:Uncharacterized protein n=1 Tax=Leptospira santarosai serovar Shermani str. LT 821 TaxID=758847 RepID=A0A097ESJ3_9LEPT|nr:hypothetical protein LSS_21720 [Leptospira santarosai serovar Shermani str. LT 821]